VYGRLSSPFRAVRPFTLFFPRLGTENFFHWFRWASFFPFSQPPSYAIPAETVWEPMLNKFTVMLPAENPSPPRFP